MAASRRRIGVFISYNKQDRYTVEQLATRLANLGFDPWIDFKGLVGGDLWRESIREGIQQAVAVVVVMTPEAMNSEWVNVEVDTAIELNKPIIPVMLRECIPIPELEKRQYINLQLGGDADDQLLQSLIFATSVSNQAQAQGEISNDAEGAGPWEPGFDEAPPPPVGPAHRWRKLWWVPLALVGVVVIVGNSLKSSEEMGAEVPSIEPIPTEQVSSVTPSPEPTATEIPASTQSPESVATTVLPSRTFGPVAVNQLTMHNGTVDTLQWSEDGKYIVSGGHDGFIYLWNMDSGEPRITITLEDSLVLDIDWVPDTNLLAAAVSNQNTALIWDTLTGFELESVGQHDDSVLDVAWSPDDTRLATAGLDNLAQIWDAESGDLLLMLSGHTSAVQCVTWSPDSNQIATGSFDHLVKVWDAATGEHLNDFRGHIGSISDVEWSPDGKHIASGSWDNTIMVWDVETGQRTTALTGHKDVVQDVVWSPDSSMIASASNDGTVKIWDVQSGTTLTTLNTEEGSMRSIDWSADGEYIAAGTSRHIIIIWKLYQ